MALFPPRREPLINYTVIDAISATGFILFDGVESMTSAGSVYHLIQENYAADIVGNAAQPATRQTQGSIQSTATFFKSVDVDFDTAELQLPRTIEGVAVCKIAYECQQSGAGNETYVILKLRKWNGGESEIASVQGSTNTTGVADEEFAQTLSITVPRTHFKKGEQIRLTVECWARSTVPNNVSCNLSHFAPDTVTSNFTAGNTRLTAAIPFKLDFL